MSFDVLIGALGPYKSLLLEIREITPFGTWELVSHTPKECWLFSSHQKSSCSSDSVHLGMFVPPFGMCRTGVSFGADKSQDINIYKCFHSDS